MFQWLKRFFNYTTQSTNPELLRAFGVDSVAGINISANALKNISAFWCGVRVLSEPIGNLPIVTYARRGNGRERAPNHPVYSLLHDRPNKNQSSVVFFETVQSHAVWHGNGYALISFFNNGRPADLTILHPSRVTVESDEDGLFYNYLNDDNKWIRLETEEVIHIPGLGYDGTQGYPIIQLAKQSFGITLALETFNATYFENAVKPSGIIQAPGKINADAMANLSKSFKEAYQGVKNSGSIPILEQGMTFNIPSIDNESIQMLGMREFQIKEISRWLKIPPFSIGDYSDSKWANIEHQQLSLWQDSIRHWISKWEAELNYKLFPQAERGRFYCEFLLNDLLRTDLESRYRAYAIGRQYGWLNDNEIRSFENLNEIENGDVYLVPSNLTTIENIINPPEPKPVAAPAVEDKPDALALSLLAKRNGHYAKN